MLTELLVTVQILHYKRWPEELERLRDSVEVTDGVEALGKHLAKLTKDPGPLFAIETCKLARMMIRSENIHSDIVALFKDLDSKEFL